MHNEGNYKQCEKTASEWEKIIANKTTDKELISKIYKQHMQLDTRKINFDPIKKWAKDWVVCFSGIELYELLVYFGDLFFVSCFVCYYFLPF